MATTARGIVYPVVGTTLTPLANHFASLATSTNTAIDNAVASGGAFRGLDAAKGAAGQEGRTYYSTDTNRTWFDDGTNWISYDGGMFTIRPTAVTGSGVSIASDGSVVFTAVPASAVVGIDGLFSSRFRDYRVRTTITNKAANSTANIQGKVGGTVISATNYSRTYQSLAGGSRSDGQFTLQNGFGEAFLGYSGSAYASIFDILSPNLPESTWMLGQGSALGGITAVVNMNASLNSADQLTGLQITLPAGATTTGVLKFYGIA